ncbi:hypothetical protein PF004_g9488 [Phytophthora fragariae]|uniref:Methyltransferase domain-containing protein n=1 Tax=Phytophthora fragariae TaxID=53985 RepID=A0A6A3L487_9STRA|nr:hypothetical protein PF011_g8793 [Phytophthora fragariae]KAE9234067.1 hypothetical protein PF004_g9488 [Phytophthora fragariae]
MTTTEGNVHGFDELGQEVLWSSRGQQVMMQWEKQYMELCVDALAIQPSDRVLEIGFGLAYSASHIQTFRPRSHTVIECDRETLQRAQQFAAAHRGVEIVAGTWQQQLHTLGQFDCIFFDDYPLPELEFLLAKDSRWHVFLDVVLEHCANGARVSGYLAREVDLQRPGCRVAVTTVQVGVPENCNYFPHKAALVPVITVVDSLVAGRGAGAGVDSLAFLPRASKKFKRAFENASRTGLAQPVIFPRERGQIAEIRDLLLAHEMAELSHEQSDSFGDEDDEDGAMNSEAASMDLSPYEDGKNSRRSSHYNDEQSRREFLSTLRSRAAASKQKFG